MLAESNCVHKPPVSTIPQQETDFREADSKDYYGLAPGKSVMLR